MSFSAVKLQVLANRFVNECDQVIQSQVLQQIFELYKKYDEIEQWRINLFNLICNGNKNDILNEEIINILSNLNVKDSISESSTILMPSIINLSTDTLMHCTQFLRLKDLLSLQQCNRHLLIECNRPNALYYLDWQTDRYFFNQNLGHFRFSQIQRLQIDHFDYNDYTIQSFENEPLLLEKNDIDTNINNGWFGFVKYLRINIVNEDYFERDQAHHLIHYQTFCDRLSVFYNVSKLIYSNGRLDKSMTYNLNKLVNPLNLQYLEIGSLKFNAKLVKNILKCKNLETLILTDLGMDLQFEHDQLGGLFHSKSITLSQLKILTIESVDDIEHEMDDHSFCKTYYAFIGHLILNSDHNIDFSFEIARRQQIPMNKLFLSNNICNISTLYFDGGQLSASYQLLSYAIPKLSKPSSTLLNLKEIIMSFEMEYDIELSQENVDKFMIKWIQFSKLTLPHSKKKLIWNIYEDDDQSCKWQLLSYFVNIWYDLVNCNKQYFERDSMIFCFEIWNKNKFKQIIESLNCENLIISWCNNFNEQDDNIDESTVTLTVKHV